MGVVDLMKQKIYDGCKGTWLILAALLTAALLTFEISLTMLGGIISGGVLGLGGSIFGGAKASQAIRKQKKRIRAKQQDNQNWFDRRFNEDATQRADAQRMLTRLQENIKNRNQAAQGQAAMMGGTDEALAATKQQNNEALADAASQIVANADARKDQIEQQYRERKDRLDDQMANLQMQQATEVGKAVQGVADAGANIASAF